MRSRLMLLAALTLFTLAVLACTLGGNTVPDKPRPSATPTGAPTLPPLAPTQATVAPIQFVPSITPTVVMTVTTTPTTTTETPAPTIPPAAIGPLSFSVSIVKCQVDPSRDGGVILTMQFDAQGGNGVYAYFREGEQVQRTFDRPATKGSAVIDAFRVTSGGQTVEQKLRFPGSQFGCP